MINREQYLPTNPGKDDYKRASIRVLQLYNDNEIKKELQQQYLTEMEKVIYPKANAIKPIVVQGGGTSTEDQWINVIEKCDKIKKKIAEIDEFNAWVGTAWERLSDDQKIALTERYIKSGYGQGKWEWRVKDIIHCSGRTAYRITEKATWRLCNLLWGTNY